MQNPNATSPQTFPNLPTDMSAPEAIMWFGQMLLSNFAPTRQYTVSEWIDHVIDTKAAAGRKRKTICGYYTEWGIHFPEGTEFRLPDSKPQRVAYADRTAIMLAILEGSRVTNTAAIPQMQQQQPKQERPTSLLRFD